MRELMAGFQSDEIRRQIYERFAQPILSTLLATIQSYFEQVYRVVPRRSEDQVRHSTVWYLPTTSLPLCPTIPKLHNIVLLEKSGHVKSEETALMSFHDNNKAAKLPNKWKRTLKSHATPWQTHGQMWGSLHDLCTGPTAAAVQPFIRKSCSSISGLLVTLKPWFLQPVIRPRRRARARNLPSLTHPFASIPNPARDALLMHEGQALPMPFPAEGGQGGMTVPIPGGQMHVEMSVEHLPIQVSLNFTDSVSSHSLHSFSQSLLL